MTNPPDSLPEKISPSENQIQQDIGCNQGQAIGQMYDGQAVDAKEIGVFVSGGSVIFQNSGNAKLPLTLNQTERAIPPLLPYLPNRSNQEFVGVFSFSPPLSGRV